MVVAEGAGFAGTDDQESTATDFALENIRQSAAQLSGSLTAVVAGGRLDNLSGFSLALESIYGRDHRVSGLPACDSESFDSSARYPMDQPFLECLGRRSN